MLAARCGLGGWLPDENARRIAALRGRHAGRRCFVLGNGPSLRIEDLDRLKDELCFGHNKIYLAFDQTSWRPTYYNVEDYRVIDQNRETINQLRGFQKILFRYKPGTWEKDGSTIEYDLFLPDAPESPNFSANPFWGIYCGWSVCYSSMQWAYFMGCTEIYVLGMDFHFVVPNVNEKDEIISEGERNHFSAKYRSKGEIWVTPRLDRQEKCFAFGRDWLAARGVRVFNATRGGKLEVFPRVDFDSLF